MPAVFAHYCYSLRHGSCCMLGWQRRAPRTQQANFRFGASRVWNLLERLTRKAHRLGPRFVHLLRGGQNGGQLTGRAPSPRREPCRMTHDAPFERGQFPRPSGVSHSIDPSGCLPGPGQSGLASASRRKSLAASGSCSHSTKGRSPLYHTTHPRPKTQGQGRHPIG
jgi:hypothetical protein